MINFFLDNQDLWIEGLQATVLLALVSFAFSLVVGIIVASFRVSPIPPLQKFAEAYVSFFRNLPLLVIFFLFFFGLGDVGIIFEPVPTAIMVLSLYTGAYMAEVVRSGINSVSQGQAEAGRAIGLSFTQLLRNVVMPQAVRTVIAPIGNLFIANWKNTAVALTISVTEVTAVSRRLITATAETWNALFVAAALYVMPLLLAGWAFRRLERRYAIKR